MLAQHRPQICLFRAFPKVDVGPTSAPDLLFSAFSKRRNLFFFSLFLLYFCIPPPPPSCLGLEEKKGVSFSFYLILVYPRLGSGWIRPNHQPNKKVLAYQVRVRFRYTLYFEVDHHFRQGGSGLRSRVRASARFGRSNRSKNHVPPLLRKLE